MHSVPLSPEEVALLIRLSERPPEYHDIPIQMDDCLLGKSIDKWALHRVMEYYFKNLQGYFNTRFNINNTNKEISYEKYIDSNTRGISKYQVNIIPIIPYSHRNVLVIIKNLIQNKCYGIYVSSLQENLHQERRKNVKDNQSFFWREMSYEDILALSFIGEKIISLTSRKILSRYKVSQQDVDLFKKIHGIVLNKFPFSKDYMLNYEEYLHKRNAVTLYYLQALSSLEVNEYLPILFTDIINNFPIRLSDIISYVDQKIKEEFFEEFYALIELNKVVNQVEAKYKAVQSKPFDLTMQSLCGIIQPYFKDISEKLYNLLVEYQQEDYAQHKKHLYFPYKFGDNQSESITIVTYGENNIFFQVTNNTTITNHILSYNKSLKEVTLKTKICNKNLEIIKTSDFLYKDDDNQFFWFYFSMNKISDGNGYFLLGKNNITTDQIKFYETLYNTLKETYVFDDNQRKAFDLIYYLKMLSKQKPGDKIIAECRYFMFDFLSLNNLENELYITFPEHKAFIFRHFNSQKEYFLTADDMKMITNLVNTFKQLNDNRTILFKKCFENLKENDVYPSSFVSDGKEYNLITRFFKKSFAFCLVLETDQKFIQFQFKIHNIVFAKYIKNKTKIIKSKKYIICDEKDINFIKDIYKEIEKEYCYKSDYVLSKRNKICDLILYLELLNELKVDDSMILMMQYSYNSPSFLHNLIKDLIKYFPLQREFIMQYQQDFGRLMQSIKQAEVQSSFKDYTQSSQSTNLMLI